MKLCYFVMESLDGFTFLVIKKLRIIIIINLEDYHKSRGNKADVEKGLLMIFTGILVHDHMKGLYKFQSDDAECNAHILRYLTFTIEKHKRKWAQDLLDLLLKIK